MRYQRLVITCFAALNVISCGQSQKASSKMHKVNFSLELTDAPATNISSVYVNVDHAELRVTKGDKRPWVIVAKNLGALDLMSLRNGVTLPMDTVSLPAGAQVTQIRLVLAASGHYIVKDGGETCQLKTPSEQKTGVKLLISKGIDLQAGYNYKVVADFDAEKSVVLPGDGGCLLKPVLKLKSASRVVVEPPSSEPVDEGQTTPEEPLPMEGDNAGDDATGGWDTQVETQEAVIGIEDVNQYMM